jgi:hypothetical protein
MILFVIMTNILLITSLISLLSNSLTSVSVALIYSRSILKKHELISNNNLDDGECQVTWSHPPLHKQPLTRPEFGNLQGGISVHVSPYAFVCNLRVNSRASHSRGRKVLNDGPRSIDQ